MNITAFLSSINNVLIAFNEMFAMPAAILFFSVAVILTFKTGFLQFRGFSYFLNVVRKGLKKDKPEKSDAKTINPFHAMFAAMATTIGMGNVVAPAMTVYVGGPGALFWLLVYIFFASTTKLTEVCFAIKTRVKEGGRVIGGPMEYLKKVRPWVAHWYAVVMMCLFMVWSAAQSNTLGALFAQEGTPEWIMGLLLAVLVFFVLRGGAQRVGNIASKLVPIMFVLYVSVSLFILLSDLNALGHAFKLIFYNVFQPQSAFGGVVGVSLLTAMKSGVFKAIFITEAGLGTSSIPHAVADVKRPIDQGILALFSMISDALLSMLSGLLVLVSGVWMQGDFRSTLIYEAFEAQAPAGGQYVLLVSISLFIITTAIGNSFNGVQTFSSLTKSRWVPWYIGATVVAIFFGSLLSVGAIWNLVDVLLILVAIPNVLGITYLAFKYPEVLKIKKS